MSDTKKRTIKKKIILRPKKPEWHPERGDPVFFFRSDDPEPVYNIEFERQGSLLPTPFAWKPIPDEMLTIVDYQDRIKKAKAKGFNAFVAPMGVLEGCVWVILSKRENNLPEPKPKAD